MNTSWKTGYTAPDQNFTVFPVEMKPESYNKGSILFTLLNKAGTPLFIEIDTDTQPFTASAFFTYLASIFRGKNIYLYRP